MIKIILFKKKREICNVFELIICNRNNNIWYLNKKRIKLMFESR